MCKAQVAVFMILLTAFSTVNCAVFPAGKCNSRHIKTVPIDIKTIIAYGKLDIPYGPEIEGIHNLDRTELQLTPKDKNSFTVVNTRYLKDKTTDNQTYVDSLVDGVVMEDAVGGGKQSHFHVYPLAVTSEDAILFYRCSDGGSESVDTRFITVPEGKSLSETSLKQLFDVDKKFKFRGSFYKFPKKLS